MLHYNPRHVSSSTMLIFRRTNCIITASGIVTLCKRPNSTPVESGLNFKQVYVQYVCCCFHKAKCYGAIFVLYMKNFKITYMEWSVIMM